MLIQYNFARVTDIATVLKSLLDSSIPRQFLDLLKYTTVFRLNDKTCCARLPSSLPATLRHATVIASEGSEAGSEAMAPI